MRLAYLAVFCVSIFVMVGFLPSLAGELSYTLLLGVTAAALYRLARQSRGLPWQQGISAMSLVALISTVANCAWVYGSVTGGTPPVLELFGATLYMFQAVPWAFALSLALMITHDKLQGSLFVEMLTLLVSLTAAVVSVSALSLGFLLDYGLGTRVADTTATLMSSALLIPALALRLARRKTALERPFVLISGATVAWAAAAILYLVVSKQYADMVYNALAIVQWFLFYSAARSYVKAVRIRATEAPVYHHELA